MRKSSGDRVESEALAPGLVVWHKPADSWLLIHDSLHVRMMIAGDYRRARDAGAADALADMADMMFHRGDADAARAVLQRAVSSGGMSAVIALAEASPQALDRLPGGRPRGGRFRAGEGISAWLGAHRG
jgi:hypothetical protein